VDDKRARQISERDTFSYNTPPSHSSFNYSEKKKISTSNKRQLQLVLQTFEKDPQLDIRKAMQFYNILHSTLSHRINSRSTRICIIANSQKLTALKKEMIVREIFNIDS